MSREIGVFIYPDHQMLDVAGPLCAFQMASRAAGAPRGGEPYRLRVLSAGGGPMANSLGLILDSAPAEGFVLDTLIVVGGNAPRIPAPDEILSIRRLSAVARRTASVCTGALLLAAAGLLDGRRATTHWRHAAGLQRDHPSIKVEADRIFVKDGPVWTSAGITAGIDLALALIEDDLGADVARDVACELVVYHRRPGGQSQFSALSELAPDSDRIRAALGFARDRLAEDLSRERLAEAACLSPRQFGRVFRRETGETPAKAIERIRAEVARDRLENSSDPVESIAPLVGFGDPERMRRAFSRLYGQPPQAIRRAARAAG